MGTGKGGKEHRCGPNTRGNRGTSGRGSKRGEVKASKLTGGGGGTRKTNLEGKNEREMKLGQLGGITGHTNIERRRRVGGVAKELQ